MFAEMRAVRKDMNPFLRSRLFLYGGNTMKSFFSTNEGFVDRVLRVVAGLAVLSLTVVGPHTMWGLLGAVPLITGLVGTCPVYSILGISTCPVKTQKIATQH